MKINDIKDASDSLKCDAKIGKYGDLPKNLFPFICADFASPEALDCIEDGSVQLFLTDVPYDDFTTLPSMFDKWYPKASKERSQFAIMYGNDRDGFYDVMAPLKKQYALIRRDEIIIAYPGGSASSAANPEKIIRCYKAVAVYAVNRNYFPCSNLIMSAGAEKDSDPHQQSVEDCKGLIPRLSDASDLVVDPYMGTGTALIAALELGRRAWGCDKDPVKIEKAKTHFVEHGLVKP
jgi:hypothetical protein